jgi:hypothetical protein
MKKVHFQKDIDLLKALIVIQEDRQSSEANRQKIMSRRINGRIDEEDDEKDSEDDDSKSKSDNDTSKNKDDKNQDKSDDQSQDKSDDESKDKEEKKKNRKLAGAQRLEDSELRPGQLPSSKDIAQRVNFIRAGASLKDKKISRNIAVWISQLREPERLAAFTTLDALAQIVLGGKSPAEAPTYEDPAGLTIKGGSASSQEAPSKETTKKPVSKVQKSDGPVPITVGEGVVKKLKEVDVPVKSGKLVTFGSKSHIADLEQRIEDIQRIRSYQEKGSDTYHSLGTALSSLKKILLSAQKRNGTGNPRTQPVPPLVEKEK